MKTNMMVVGLLLLAVSCGQKSEIKPSQQVSRLGDGENIPLSVVVPLTEKSISSFKSPVAGVNPLFRGFVGSIMNLGASMGAGKTRLTMLQPLPEIPDTISSLKIKRIFFYIEPEKKKEDFRFLRRLALKLSSESVERDNDQGWEPVITTDSLDKNELNFFTSLFRRKRDQHAAEWDKNSEGLLMIRYDQNEQEESLKKKEEVGVINIMRTSKPASTRKYLEDKYGKYLKRMHTLSRSILVELIRNPVVEEMFLTRLSEDSQIVEDLDVEIVDCDNKVCLDLQVPDVNLIPLLKQGNTLKVDAYIDPKEAPKSFQLKGFPEFEVKIKSKI